MIRPSVRQRQIPKLFSKEKLPWKLRETLRRVNNLSAYCRRLLKFPGKQITSFKINVTCGYHGLSGGSIAMANLASLLARGFDVDFLTYPTSNLNPLLGAGVRLRQNIDCGTDLFIADVMFDKEQLTAARKRGAKVIVCCHGLPDTSHGLPPEYVTRSLETADKVVFVSAAQAKNFKLPQERYTIIPNVTSKIEKTVVTNNVGVLGNLDDPRKGAEKTVAVGLRSKAEHIHLWGMMNGSYRNSRVVVHSWEVNKKKIYDSFDVLIFFSEQETFGMIVIESMSAGIPCLLSNLEVFEEFCRCPGVVIVKDDDMLLAHEIVNDMLRDKNGYRDQMIRYWRENYSIEVISKRWVKLIHEINPQRIP